MLRVKTAIARTPDGLWKADGSSILVKAQGFVISTGKMDDRQEAASPSEEYREGLHHRATAALRAFRSR